MPLWVAAVVASPWVEKQECKVAERIGETEGFQLSITCRPQARTQPQQCQHRREDRVKHQVGLVRVQIGAQVDWGFHHATDSSRGSGRQRWRRKVGMRWLAENSAADEAVVQKCAAACWASWCIAVELIRKEEERGRRSKEQVAKRA